MERVRNMTERRIRRNIKKTAEKIEGWTAGTEQLLDEISSFLETAEENNLVPEESAGKGQRGAAEAALQDVRKYLEEVKEKMTGLKDLE